MLNLVSWSIDSTWGNIHSSTVLHCLEGSLDVLVVFPVHFIL